MRFINFKSQAIIFLIILTLSCDETSDFPTSAIQPHYTKKEIYGFTVFVENEALKRAITEQAITLLDEKLAEITEFEFKEGILQDLQEVKIFLDWKQTDRCGVYYSDEPDEKDKSVGFENVEWFIKCIENGSPYLVLHELSHAFHDLVLDHTNQLIIDAYDYAMGMQLYDVLKPIQKDIIYPMQVQIIRSILPS